MTDQSITSAIRIIQPWLGNGAINIFGMPFAGKDTRAKELAKLLDGVVIGGGDLLRSNPELANLNEAVKDGSLAPTKEFVEAIVPYFSQASFRNKPLLLSAVGRWHGEEPAIIRAAQESGHPIKAVIYISITPDEMRRRWEISQKQNDRGMRHDDAEHVLEKRVEEFTTKTLPVVEYYRQKGLLVEVSGQDNHQAVLRELLTALTNYAQNHQ